MSKTESSSNATHWTATILCKGCSKWEGAAVAATGNWTFGWGVSSRPVDNPTNVNASIRFHDVGKSHFEVDMAGARIKDFAAATKGFV